MEWDNAQKQVLTLLQEGKSILLSGKAGSGKSTLLQAFCQGAMDTVICAPTGLAALNVGGTTIHSLFELPILHAAGGMDENNEEPLITRITPELLAAQPLSDARKQVLKQTKTIIIDEISLVRADVFDAIHWRLQEATNSEEPFGGKQIVAVGDFMQLGPVVRRDPAQANQSAKSVYAFQSTAWRNLMLQQIFLSKVYRQAPEEQLYLELLNAIRYGDKATLNCWQPSGKTLLQHPNQAGCSRAYRSCLCLCPTNRVADAINQQEWERLPGESFVFSARICGEFPQEYYPTDAQLQLKVGMRVMLLVNVRNPEVGGFLYVNGDLAVITDIFPDQWVQVTLDRTGQSISVEYMTWENIEYRLNDERVTAANVGSFRQLPIRPAYGVVRT